MAKRRRTQLSGLAPNRNRGGTRAPIILTEEERIKILQEKGVRVPAGTSLQQVNEMIRKGETSAPITATNRAKQHAVPTHHGYGREDIPTTQRSHEVMFTTDKIPTVTEGKSPAIDFTHALMTGNPHAEKILSDMERQARAERESQKTFGRKKEDVSLADQFIAATYNMPKRLMVNAHGRKLIEPTLSAYRRDMRKANRFALDDDFTKYASEVACACKPEKLLARLQYATLPYETTWIEFSMMPKVKTMRALHNMDDSEFDYSNVADRMGLLMHRLDETSALVEMIVETQGDYGLVGSVICYYYSLNERQWQSSDGRNFGAMPLVPEIMDKAIDGVVTQQVWDAAQGQRNKHIAAASLWGYDETGKSKLMTSMRDLGDLRVPSFLMRHGVLGWSRQYYLFDKLPAFQAQTGKDALIELLANEVTEFAGTMRWIACVLAMLNEVPIATRLVEPRSYIRTGLTNRIPSMDYHKVTLRLPKKNPVKFIERQFVIATRRRAHMVRQHWRTYLKPEHCRYDEHDWVYDYDNGYRLCGRCESQSTLIPEHKRGDESLGWVKKDYVIKTSDEKED